MKLHPELNMLLCHVCLVQAFYLRERGREGGERERVREREGIERERVRERGRRE